MNDDEKNIDNPFYISKGTMSIPSDSVDKIYTKIGSKEGTTHHTVLEKKTGFSRCTLLGKSMDAYII